LEIVVVKEKHERLQTTNTSLTHKLKKLNIIFKMTTLANKKKISLYKNTIAVLHEDVHNANAKLVQLNEEKLCCICLEKEKNILLLDCGHISVCERCARKLNACPLCRCDISSKIKIYY